MKMKKGQHCVYGIEYHIVWCTKYRRKVLTSKIEGRLHELLNHFAEANGFEIITMNGEEDHIHLLISATPTTAIPNIVKGMKGVSARMLFKEFPEIKKDLYGGHLWSPSYFVCTVSDNTEENIKKYIESQKQQ